MVEIDDKMFKEALNRLAATDDGRMVFAIIKDSCGWDMTVLSSDNPESSHYYAVKRGVYGGLRQHIRPEHLKIIEFDYKRKAVKDDRGTKPTRTAATVSGVTS